VWGHVDEIWDRKGKGIVGDNLSDSYQKRYKLILTEQEGSGERLSMKGKNLVKLENT
jgi:hypothetical protein